MPTAKWAEISISVILAAVSVYIILEASSFPEAMTPGSPGPALFPRLLALTLLFLSTLLFLQDVRGKTDAPRPIGWRRASRVGLLLSLIVAFLLLVDAWDTYILLPILLASTMFLMGERRIWLIATVPLLFDLFVYVVFYRIFNIQLPTVYF